MPTELSLQEELQLCRNTSRDNPLALMEPLNRLARWYCDHRQPQRARPLVQEMWTLNKQFHGATDQRTVCALVWLASLLNSCGKPQHAEKLLADSIVLLRVDPALPLPMRAAVWNQLVEVYHRQARLPEALQLSREVVEFLCNRAVPQAVRDTPEYRFQLNRARNNLGALYFSLGAYREAERAFKKNLSAARKRQPDNVIVIAQLLSNLAVVVQHRGFIEHSERLTRRAISKCRRAFGNVHPLLAQGLSNLAACRMQAGRPSSALSLFRKALKIRRQLHPGGHFQVSRAMQQLAEAHLVLGHYSVAERLLERVRTRLERQHPVDEIQLARTLCSLGFVFLQSQRLGSSLNVFQQACDLQERLLGTANLQLVPTLYGLGKVELAHGRFESAQTFCCRALEIAERHLGQDHPDLVQILILLGQVSLARGETSTARIVTERALSIRESRLGKEHPLLAEVLVACGQIAVARKQPDQALAIAARAKQLLQQANECPPLDLANVLAVEADAASQLLQSATVHSASLDELRLREQIVGMRHVTLLPAIRRLSGVYLEQRQLEQAEPLLRRGLTIAESALPNRGDRSIFFTESMGQLFLARQDFEEAGRWMERTVKTVQRQYGPHASQVAEALFRFASLLRTARRGADAETFERRAVEVRNLGSHALL